MVVVIVIVIMIEQSKSLAIPIKGFSLPASCAGGLNDGMYEYGPDRNSRLKYLKGLKAESGEQFSNSLRRLLLPPGQPHHKTLIEPLTH